METNNYKKIDPILDHLKREFSERRRRRPNYSLRAFANFLNIDQSLLSKLINGNRRLSRQLKAQIIDKLGMNPTQFESSNNMYQIYGTENFKKIDNVFHVISDWYHFAILEYLKINDASHSPEEIAKRFNLHLFEVEVAIDRLIHLDFLERSGEKLVLKSPNNSWAQLCKTNSAKQKYQKKILEKSTEALEDIDINLRDHSSLTVAISKSRMMEFKEKIKQMRAELADFFQMPDEANLDEVYQLSISLFPLTKINLNKKGEKP